MSRAGLLIRRGLRFVASTMAPGPAHGGSLEWGSAALLVTHPSRLGHCSHSMSPSPSPSGFKSSVPHAALVVRGSYSRLLSLLPYWSLLDFLDLDEGRNLEGLETRDLSTTSI